MIAQLLRTAALGSACATVVVGAIAWAEARHADRREAMYARANRAKSSEAKRDQQSHNTRTASALGRDTLAVRNHPRGES